MALSRKDFEDLKPQVDKIVQKYLGFSEPTLVTAALNCVDKGYDRRKTKDKLSMIIDDRHVSKIVDKTFDMCESHTSGSKHRSSRKRKEDSRHDSREHETQNDGGSVDGTLSEPVKKIKRSEEPDLDEGPIPEPGQPSPGQLTADKIKDMMSSAQAAIRMRKAQLQQQMPTTPATSITPQAAAAHLTDALDKRNRASQLQAQIQAQLARSGFARQSALSDVGIVPPTPAFAIPKPQGTLLLDSSGRTVDAKTGEVIALPQHVPTLKANIRARRREELVKEFAKPVPEEIQDSKFFDDRVGLKASQRARRGFKFHDQGRFESMATRLRTKAQLDKLQNEIAQAAKKTGIASAARLATILPKKQLKEGEIPDVEWWDSVILSEDFYETVSDESNIIGITHLVEHPSQMKPPAEPIKPPEIAIMLTAKERKKLRRQNRNEAQKEITEKIRLGLEPPPEPKVRMANLMRVLGTEAVQDPTKVEQHVREQMAKRQKGHEEANANRKLTKEQRRDKKIKKIKEDVTLGVNVAVYRIRNLHNPSKKFKVETNANQLYMTGLVILHKDCNVVVVEGGPKQQKKFHRLMMHRIKWAEDRAVAKNDDNEDDSPEKQNSCHLVWQGEVLARAFGEMKFKSCPTESFAREQFKKSNVEHYWDLAYSGSILEAAVEED